MDDWKALLTTPQTSILKTMAIIDQGAKQIAFVVDNENHLLGTVSDGDVRRGLLKGTKLDEPVELIMNTSPITAGTKDSPKQILNLMQKFKLNRIPIINENRQLIGLQALEELVTQTSEKSNWVVIMAGGLGTRLYPLTKDCPKPLLSVGGRPLLETVIRSYLDAGFRRFYLSVNYKAEMIKNYFNDGSKWGVEIQYIHENQRMGTAGALGLLPSIPSEPIIVTNGDILTKVDFNQLLKFHELHQADATMGVREYDFQVPYGVVQLNEEAVISIDEKPIQRFFVNGGIYVLDPSILQMIPKNTHLDMPILFRQLREKNKRIVAFPILEYWRDIGQEQDFHLANHEYKRFFE